jgi:hypothetical protein
MPFTIYYRIKHNTYTKYSIKRNPINECVYTLMTDVLNLICIHFWQTIKKGIEINISHF